MPLYEYLCSACQHEFELIQKFGDSPVRKCPSCGKSKAKKKISLAGFQLKGGGWYSDGYNKPAAGDAKTSGSAPEKKSDKDSSKKTDKKTETKTPTASTSKNQAA